MPLEAGKGREAFGKNVKTEMEAGKPQKQAVAIAYAQQRKDMMNNTPGLSALADAVDKLNTRIDSMGNRMDAMRQDTYSGPSAAQIQTSIDRYKLKIKELTEKGRGKSREADDCRKNLMYSKQRLTLAQQAGKGEAKADASKEVHEFYASHAKKTAQKAIDGGDPKLAAKWVDYGTSHSKQAEDKAEKMEGPPEDKKKDEWSDEARKKAAESRKSGGVGGDDKGSEIDRHGKGSPPGYKATKSGNWVKIKDK